MPCIENYTPLQVLQDILEPNEQNRGYLVVISELFDHLNDVYLSFLDAEMQSQVIKKLLTKVKV